MPVFGITIFLWYKIPIIGTLCCKTLQVLNFIRKFTAKCYYISYTKKKKIRLLCYLFV